MRGHLRRFRRLGRGHGRCPLVYGRGCPAFLAIEDHSLGGDGIHGKGGPMPVWLPQAEGQPLARAYIEAGAALGLQRIAGHNSGQMIGVLSNS